MPNGQDRRAEKARNRTPRKGRTIRMGKKLGTAPVECRIDDLARELLPRMSQLSKKQWDQWLEYYQQCNVSTDGQCKAQLSDAKTELIRGVLTVLAAW